jgi:hypothetical protein
MIIMGVMHMYRNGAVRRQSVTRRIFDCILALPNHGCAL